MPSEVIKSHKYNWMENCQPVHFILFVNTKSGDGSGAAFLSLGGNQITIRYESNHTAQVYIFDLFDASSRNNGLGHALHLSKQPGVDCRVVICGGDGSIPWVLSELLGAGVDLEQVVIGILPIGTGNDFSRSLGWGSNGLRVSKDNLRGLGGLVKNWMNAAIGFYDMWDVEVTTFPDGTIYDIKNQQEVQRQEKSFRKMFSNYVGMGLDARVVYTVERHRTPVAFLNKVVYGLIGFLNFFRPMKRLQQTVSSITQGRIKQASQVNSANTETTSERKSNALQDSLLPEEKYPLRTGFCGLVCLNCTSYMAGLRKVWQTKAVSVSNRKHSDFAEQAVDDGQLQFVSFKSELNLALERIMRSGERAMQGSGPFEITMKQPQQDEITYMQIDGESIKLKNLQSIRISKTNKINGHRLKVMVNPKGER